MPQPLSPSRCNAYAQTAMLPSSSTIRSALPSASARMVCILASQTAPSPMRLADARERLGREAQIGVTCHASRHLAMDAGEAGVDYVAFGAFFPTTTKQVEHRAEPELLTWWQGLFEVPCVAIGGITPDNACVLVEAGADFLAVSAAVWDHDEAVAVASLHAAIAGD
jgi:thiamine monophosphate synthase